MKQDMIVILDLGCTENTATARAIRACRVNGAAMLSSEL